MKWNKPYALGEWRDFTTAKTARFPACRQGTFEGVKNDLR